MVLTGKIYCKFPTAYFVQSKKFCQMLTAAFAPMYCKVFFDEFINEMHSCLEEEFQKPSVLSGVFGVALFPRISWPEIHKLSKLLPYFRLIQHNKRMSRVLESYCFSVHQKRLKA